ncbi:hypothetical protein Agub_g2846, partial [Astrephomene gubernaculifera]
QLTLTPPEVVALGPLAPRQPSTAVVTLGDLKQAAAAAFSETYRMCRRPGGGDIAVTSIVQGIDEQTLSGGDSASLAPALAAAAAAASSAAAAPPGTSADAPPTSSSADGSADTAAAAGTLPPAALTPQPTQQPQAPPSQPPPPPLAVVIRCSGLDTDLRWRHAGGPEDWRVACLCGTQDDDGERMIACDVCGVWSHTRCNDIPDDADEPSSYVCRACSSKGGGSGGARGRGK